MKDIKDGQTLLLSASLQLLTFAACSISILLLPFSFQCYLFAYFSVWRNSKSFLAFALICLSNMYLYELRNMWQILFHVAVGAFMTLQIKLRQPLGKAPDYNV